MTPQQLIGVGVRLFALWLLVRAIPYFGSIPGQLIAMSIPGGEKASMVSYGIGIAYLMGVILLWVFPMAVAHRLLPRTNYTNILTFRSYELARVGCGLLGLWLLATELPALTWFLFRAFLVAGSTSSFETLDGQAKLEVIVAVVELGIAVIFITKADLFARLIADDPKTGPELAPDDL